MRIANEILMFFRSCKKSAQDVSMNEPIDTDKDGNALVLMDVMATEDLIVEELDTKIQAEKMYRYIEEVLSELEKVIIKLRYDLGGKVPLTQREVAQKLNISRSYVSRIEKMPCRCLKNASIRCKIKKCQTSSTGAPRDAEGPMGLRPA